MKKIIKHMDYLDLEVMRKQIHDFARKVEIIRFKNKIIK